jgi:DNA-binding NarL/FixJ family response regulator
MQQNENIKIILVDDHDIVRDGIKSLLAGVAQISIIGEANSAVQLFSMLKILQPDVILLDINLPGKSGIEVTRELTKTYPNIAILILSMYNTEDYVFNAIRAGALGYLPKSTTKQELVEAIISVSKGKEYFSHQISNIILKSFVRQAKNHDEKKEAKLSQRESEILKLFAEGTSNAAIAEKLFISVRTVESHKNHIMQKLELKSTIDLIKFAIRNQIIEI